jgi:Domain of unknown function (DU1801)
MKSNAKTVEEYLQEIQEERKPYFSKLRDTILANLPSGLKEEMNYGMIGYVVPHSIYPARYHCSPELPLPFINIASQKNYIAFYHMGFYSNKELLNWFISEYPKYCKYKLDMGKSCIRFKKPEEIPFELIGQLMRKISVKDYITTYEASRKK